MARRSCTADLATWRDASRPADGSVVLALVGHACSVAPSGTSDDARSDASGPHHGITVLILERHKLSRDRSGSRLGDRNAATAPTKTRVSSWSQHAICIGHACAISARDHRIKQRFHVGGAIGASEHASVDNRD